MMRLLVAGFIGLLLFAGSAAATWFLMRPSEPAVQQEPHDDGPQPPLPRIAHGEGEQTAADNHEPQPVSAEAIVRLGQSIRAREEALQRRQERVELQEARLKHLFADLEQERAALEALQQQIEAKIQQAARLVEDAQSQQQELEKQRTDTQNQLNQSAQARASSAGNEQQNVQTIAEWLQGVSPERAAEYLKKMTDSGQMDMAVQLLWSFEQRSAAKVLDQMQDPVLVADLLQAVKNFKPPSPR